MGAHIKILVIEDEPDVSEIYSLTLQAALSNVEVLHSKDAEQAIAHLNTNPSIDLIITDARLETGHANDVLKHIQTLRKTTPSYTPPPIILSSGNELNEISPELQPLISKYIAKPCRMAEIAKSASELILRGPSKSISNEPPLDYCGVQLDFLMRLGVLEFDIYIDIGADKFVKTHKKGDVFTESDAHKYKSKNQTKLHVLKSEVHDFLNKHLILIDASIGQNLTKETNSSPHLKVSKETYELLIGLYKDKNYGEQELKAIGALINSTARALTQNPTAKQALQVLWDHSHSYLTDHSISLAYIAAVFAERLEWSSDLIHTKLAAAALLHDLPLKNDALAKIQSEEALLEAKSSLSREEIALWLHHGKLACDLTKSIDGLPPDLQEIILYHHDTPHTLLEHGLNAAKISPLVALFSIAHAVLTRIIAAQDKTMSLNTCIAELPDYYNQGQFGVVSRALKTNALN